MEAMLDCPSKPVLQAEPLWESNVSGRSVPAGLCCPKSTNHGPIITCVGYVHLTCTPTGQSCEGTKGGSQPRLDPCPIKDSVAKVPELVVMVLVVEPVRVKASKGVS